MPRKGIRLRRLGRIPEKSLNRSRTLTTKHDYYEKTYQSINRLFPGIGWSRVGATASRTTVTIKGQARPAKSARDSSTTRRERSQASGKASEANRRDEGTRRDE